MVSCSGSLDSVAPHREFILASASTIQVRRLSRLLSRLVAALEEAAEEVREHREACRHLAVHREAPWRRREGAEVDQNPEVESKNLVRMEREALACLAVRRLVRSAKSKNCSRRPRNQAQSCIFTPAN